MGQRRESRDSERGKALKENDNFVVMKMEVSHLDHSHIIGRSGVNINSIMKQSKTHIHFPDHNNTNPTDRSNQVTLGGSFEGLEEARTLIRSSSPLLFSFEVPIKYLKRKMQNAPVLKRIQKEFDVELIFCARRHVDSSMILVKGSVKEHLELIKATTKVLSYIFVGDASKVIVKTRVNVSVNHQASVCGENFEHLRKIVGTSKIEIIVPDIKDVNLDPVKRCQLSITGDVTNVYRVREQMLANLPITLIIDCPKTNFTAAELAKMVADSDVSITVRSKSRPNYMRIAIEGPEKSIQNVYGAAQQLIKMALSTKHKQNKRTIAQRAKGEPHAKPINEIQVQPSLEDWDDQGAENSVVHNKNQLDPEAGIVPPKWTRRTGVSKLSLHLSLLELSPYNHTNEMDCSGSSGYIGPPGDSNGSPDSNIGQPGDFNIGQQWTPLSTIRFNGSLAPGAELRQLSYPCLCSNFFGHRM